MLRKLFIDTETTGFNPNEGHRIIEFAALEMVANKLTGKVLHLYFNPKRDIPIEATNVHGITLEMLVDKPTFDQCTDEIVEFISDAELIIHNAKFDLAFLDHHFNEFGKLPTLNYAASVVDTLAMARNKFPGGKNSLDALCDRFKIDRANRTYHGALVDCELLAAVYAELIKEQMSLLGDNRKGQNSNNINFAHIDSTQFDLANAHVTTEETELHINYLKKLNKISRGNSTWFNKIKDYVD